MYMYTHIYVSGQATMPLVWNLIKWLFLLWFLINVCSTISCSFFMQFSPFNHTIIPHLYIFTPIFIVSPNSLGLMLFVCNWCDKKIKFILSYLMYWQFFCYCSPGKFRYKAGEIDKDKMLRTWYILIYIDMNLLVIDMDFFILIGNTNKNSCHPIQM